jgi:hypothetical protein
VRDAFDSDELARASGLIGLDGPINSESSESSDAMEASFSSGAEGAPRSFLVSKWGAASHGRPGAKPSPSAAAGHAAANCPEYNIERCSEIDSDGEPAPETSAGPARGTVARDCSLNDACHFVRLGGESGEPSLSRSFPWYLRRRERRVLPVTSSEFLLEDEWCCRPGRLLSSACPPGSALTDGRSG